MAKKTEQKARFILEGENKLDGPLGAAGGSLKKFKDFALSPAGIAVGILTAGLVAGAIAAKKFAETMASELKSVAEFGDEIQKTSIRLGLQAEELSALSFAAERSGASRSSITASTRALARAATEAADGNAEYAETFEALGVEILGADGKLKPLKELFLDTADAVGKITNSTERLGLAQQVLGRGATELSVLFLEQREGMESLMEEAGALGGVMSTDLANSSAEFVDSMTDLDFAMAGVKQTIAAELLPVVTKAISFLAAFVAENRSAIEDVAVKTGEIVEKFVDVMIPFVTEYGPPIVAFFADVARFSIEVAEGIAEVVDKVTGFEKFREAITVAAALDEWAASQANVGEEVKSFADLLANQGDSLNAGLLAFSGAATDATDVSGMFGRQLVVMNAEADALALNFAKVEKEIKAVAATMESIEFPVPDFGDDFPADMPADETGPTLPDVDMMDDVASRFGMLSEAVQMFGADAVSSTLEIDRSLARVGKTAEKAFINDMGRSLRFAMSATTKLAVHGIRTGKDMGAQASAMWGSFVDDTIAKLIALIAKLTLAAALQAFLGFGNFAAVAQVGQFFGVDVAKPEGKRFGGVAGYGGGDTIPTLLEAGEFVATKEQVNRIGQSALHGSLQGGELPGLSAPGAIGGLEVTIHTFGGSREQGAEIGRGLLQVLIEEGYLRG